MFNKEKREKKKAERLEKIEALQGDAESHARQMAEAEILYQEFSILTLGNEKRLDKLIQQANDSEILKCVSPGNVKIVEKVTGKKVSSFPGAWFVSDQRVLLCFPEPFGKTHVYEYPVETLESVSVRKCGLTAGNVRVATADELITFTVSLTSKEEIYRIEQVFNDLIKI